MTKQLREKITKLVVEMEKELKDNGIRENFICPYEHKLTDYCSKNNIHYTDDCDSQEVLRNEAVRIGVL